ncbi:response regulator [Massilia sp. W12]|uniref:response regulator n=1 Tax=Massilia sp. W12 TaxID=3126507 RepID=UPI0030CD34FD
MESEQVMRERIEHVVLLDDDSFMLSVMEEMMRDLGAQHVHCFSNAKDALCDILRWPRALLVCDLRMPDMDGIEFLDKLARLGYAGNVVLHSGVGAGVMRAAEKLARAHGLTVLGAYEKPIDRVALLHSLATS